MKICGAPAHKSMDEKTLLRLTFRFSVSFRAFPWFKKKRGGALRRPCAQNLRNLWSKKHKTSRFFRVFRGFSSFSVPFSNSALAREAGCKPLRGVRPRLRTALLCSQHPARFTGAALSRVGYCKIISAKNPY